MFGKFIDLVSKLPRRTLLFPTASNKFVSLDTIWYSFIIINKPLSVPFKNLVTNE